jgi:hypothetical protein
MTISSSQEYRIVEDVIKHANTTSKLSDVALICTLDICRAAIHVPPEGEVPLRLIGNEIAHEIKVTQNFSRASLSLISGHF